MRALNDVKDTHKICLLETSPYLPTDCVCEAGSKGLARQVIQVSESCVPSDRGV